MDEGQSATNIGAWTDLGDDVVSLTASLGSVAKNSDGTWSWSYSASDDLTTTVTITGTDDDGQSSSANFDLVVNNVSPTANNAAFDLVENAPDGTSVGSITASDPGTDTLSYTITGGTGAGAFATDPLTGQITVSDSSQLDYESATSFTLEVTVTDDDGLAAVATVGINLLNLSSIGGAVFVDANQNGQFDANEIGIDSVIIDLLDEFGSPVLDEHGTPIRTVTGHGGSYLFEDLAPGTYRVREQQPTGVSDGPEFLGSLGGSISANDTMQLTLERTDAFDYVFSEFGQELGRGDTAGIGFWQNKHGQELITRGGSALAAWLTDNFANVFGDQFVEATGADVAAFYKDQLFKQQAKKTAGVAKVDAQFMAVALAAYFTSRNLAGDLAANFGFNVSDSGIGTKSVNVGSSGAAFGVADNTNVTIHAIAICHQPPNRHAESANQLCLHL